MPQWFSILSPTLSMFHACLWMTAFCWSSVLVDGRSLWSSFPMSIMGPHCTETPWPPSAHQGSLSGKFRWQERWWWWRLFITVLGKLHSTSFWENYTHIFTVQSLNTSLGSFYCIIFMLPTDMLRVGSRNKLSLTGPSISTLDQARLHIQPKFPAMATHLLMFLSSTDEHHGSGFYLLKKKKKNWWWIWCFLLFAA